MNKKPRKPRRWLYPAGVERDYQRQLTSVAKKCTDVISNQLLPALLLRVRQDAKQAPDLPIDPDSDWHRTLTEILDAMIQSGTLSDSELNELVVKVGQQTVTFNKSQLNAVLKSAYGVDVITKDPDLSAALDVWESENIKLIKSIPSQYADQLRTRIVAAVQKGTSLREMTKQIKETYDLPKNRAELIARDQIGKLNGQLTQKRQQAIGVEEYKWRGAMDGRERETHVAREGKTFRWDNPPSDGNPGQPIRCRCSAEGVFPDFEDLKGLFAYN